MSNKIYTYPGNPNVAKALITAQFAGVADKFVLAEDFKMGVTNKTEEFLKINPVGQVPAMSSEDGPLFESNALAYYVAHKYAPQLLGKNSYEFALIHQWTDFVANWCSKPLGTWIYPYFGYTPYNEDAEKAAKTELKSGKNPLGVLNKHFENNTYFLGDTLTMADIINFAILARLFIVAAPEYLEDLPHLVRYLNHLAQIPQFIDGNNGKKLAFLDKAPEVPKK